MTDLLLIFLAAALVNDLVLVGLFDRAQGLVFRERLGFSVVTGSLLIFLAALHVLGLQASLPQEANAYLLACAFMTTAIAATSANAHDAALVRPALLRVRRHLPLLVGNLAVFAYALLDASQLHSLTEVLGFCLGATVSFAVVATFFSAMRERLTVADLPQSLRGTPIMLLTAGLIALATMGAVGSVPW